MDDDRNRKLSKEEFRKGVEEYGLHFTKNEIDDLFRAMDSDQSDSIDYEEFLRRLRVGYTVMIERIARCCCYSDSNVCIPSLAADE